MNDIKGVRFTEFFHPAQAPNAIFMGCFCGGIAQKYRNLVRPFYHWGGGNVFMAAPVFLLFFSVV